MIKVTRRTESAGEIHLTLAGPEDMAAFRHDVAGAYRTLDYLVGKIRKQYSAEAAGTAKIESLDKHLATPQLLRDELVYPAVGKTRE